MRLELGTSVRCTDGDFGKLADVVIDPAARRVTHIVVDPHHKLGTARLVPVDLAEAADDGISLRCTVEEAQALETAQHFAFLHLGEAPVEDPKWDVGIEHVLAMPASETDPLGGFVSSYDEGVSIAYDRVPKGEVEIRRASSVMSADGEHVGHVDSFLLDSDNRISHLVLSHGHMWKKRHVAIPVDTVTRVDTDSVTVGLKTRELEDLPAVPKHRRLD